MEQPTYIFGLAVSPVGLQPGETAKSVKKALSEELDTDLRSVELSAIDQEPFSNEVPAYKALINRRARIALLEIVTKVEEDSVILEIHPAHVVAAIEGQYGGWFQQILERKLSEVLDLNRGDVIFRSVSGVPEVDLPSEPTPAVQPREEVSRLSKTMQRFGAVLLLVPIIAFSVLLILFYNWASDIRQDYDDLQSTIEVQKKQILTAIEEGIEKSTDVMDIIDVVKEFTVGEDSTDKN